MEDFEKLLEDYLDFEEYGEKDKDLDIYECKSSSTESPFTQEDSISISKFVNHYLEFDCDAKNLYHSGLRELQLDYVIGIDNNFANKNSEYVKRGFLLIVIDAKGKRGTYLNPVYIKKYLERADIAKVLSTFQKIQQIEFPKLDEYFNRYLEALMQFEEREKFKTLLLETHKMNKIRKLERRMKND
ncbi:MAG: hypothetical protein E7158_05345 [Firmicutes bacterium]|nr:hypothetical protein [Bacillota bacterium]